MIICDICRTKSNPHLIPVQHKIFYELLNDLGIQHFCADCDLSSSREAEATNVDMDAMRVKRAKDWLSKRTREFEEDQ